MTYRRLKARGGQSAPLHRTTPATAFPANGTGGIVSVARRPHPCSALPYISL